MILGKGSGHETPLPVGEHVVHPQDGRNASCCKLSVDKMCHLDNSQKCNT